MAKKKILMIEDEIGFHRILTLYIKKKQLQFELISAYRGDDGLKKAKQETPDLIILDLTLPGLPGEEVCRQIRKDQKISETPIIMLTAKNTDTDRVIGRVIGANLYLTKPCELDDLLKEINKMVEI